MLNLLQGPADGGVGPVTLVQGFECFFQRLYQLFAVHHYGPLLGQLLLLAFNRLQAAHLVHGVTQKFLIPLGRRHSGLGLLEPFNGGPPRLKRVTHLRNLPAQPAESVDKPAMGGGIKEPVSFVLSMHLYELLADLAQQGNAHRLIVNEGTGPAISIDHAAQDQPAASVFDPRVA